MNSVLSWFQKTKTVRILYWKMTSRSPARSKKAPADAPGRRVRRSRRPSGAPKTDPSATYVVRPLRGRAPPGNYLLFARALGLFLGLGNLDGGYPSKNASSRDSEYPIGSNRESAGTLQSQGHHRRHAVVPDQTYLGLLRHLSGTGGEKRHSTWALNEV